MGQRIGECRYYLWCCTGPRCRDPRMAPLGMNQRVGVIEEEEKVAVRPSVRGGAGGSRLIFFIESGKRGR